MLDVTLVHCIWLICLYCIQSVRLNPCNIQKQSIHLQGWWGGEGWGHKKRQLGPQFSKVLKCRFNFQHTIIVFSMTPPLLNTAHKVKELAGSGNWLGKNSSQYQVL